MSNKSINHAADANPLVVTEGRFIGSVVEVTDKHVLQDVGRGKLVAHDKANLAEVPAVGKLADLLYKNGIGRAVEQLTHDNHSVGISLNSRE